MQLTLAAGFVPFSLVLNTVLVLSVVWGCLVLLVEVIECGGRTGHGIR